MEMFIYDELKLNTHLNLFIHQYLPNGHYHIAPLVKIWHTRAINKDAVTVLMCHCALCQKQCDHLTRCLGLYHITGSGLYWTVVGGYQVLAGGINETGRFGSISTEKGEQNKTIREVRGEVNY